MTLAALLAACPPPGGGGTSQPTTYTTTVSGTVITPARAADPTKGSTITTARVWSSIDSAKKVAVGTDGSYSLQVAGHSGSFTITAEYTATGNKNYKTSTPKTVTTKGASIENQDIALNYGYTTEVTMQVFLHATTTSGGTISSGVTVVITAEDGHEVGRGITASGGARTAVLSVDHPGRMIITASRDGYMGNAGTERTTKVTTASTARPGSLNLYASL